MSLFLNWGRELKSHENCAITRVVTESIMRCRIDSGTNVQKLVNTYGEIFDLIIPSSIVIKIFQKDHLSGISALRQAHDDLDLMELKYKEKMEGILEQVRQLEEKGILA